MTTARDAARAVLEWKPTREWCEAFTKEYGLKIPEGSTCRDVLFLRLRQMAEEGNVEARCLAEKYGIPYQVSP